MPFFVSAYLFTYQLVGSEKNVSINIRHCKFAQLPFYIKINAGGPLHEIPRSRPNISHICSLKICWLMFLNCTFFFSLSVFWGSRTAKCLVGFSCFLYRVAVLTDLFRLGSKKGGGRKRSKKLFILALPRSNARSPNAARKKVVVLWLIEGEPDRLFDNFRASKSGDRPISSSPGISCDGFWSSKVVERPVGKWIKNRMTSCYNPLSDLNCLSRPNYLKNVNRWILRP